MPLDWTPFVTLVKCHASFLLLTHVRPDGDALGSLLGLYDAIVGLGKRAHPVIATNRAARYAFMDPENKLERFRVPGDDYRKVEAVIIVDTGTWNQLGDCGPLLRELTVPKLVIDHHPTQDDLSALRLVDTNAEAAGRLVYEARQALEVPLTPFAARSLFVALATDTGWFRHPSVTARTFALATDLVRGGAQPHLIHEALGEANSAGRLKLLARALDRIQTLDEGRIAYTEVYLSDYTITGALPSETDDLINYPRSLAGVEVGLLLIEQPQGGVKVSMRSRMRVNIGRVAEQLGGGGHRLAAGATVSGQIEEVRPRVFAALQAAIAADLAANPLPQEPTP
jgi:phosphoesterase RecJ-like protein